jgi:4-hydroxy-3-methylbut-2-en-1-yl diphosphate reductase
MEVILAKSAGFCFGVKRAVDTVYEQIAKSLEDGRYAPIYTYGPIIHNESVVGDLEKKGVVVINSLSELKALQSGGGTVIIRSHGAARAVHEEIQRLGFSCIDATCPFVKRIHKIVEKESGAGKQIVIIGNPGHPEVEGIMGWSKTPATVIESGEEAKKFTNPKQQEICLVSQTTFNYNKFQDLVEIMKEKGYNVSVANTICNATEERQTEAKDIASRVDAMIVIGGTHSSNTRKLYEICKKECENTYFIQTLDDLQLDFPNSVLRVGITAGASTPNNIIEEVQNYVRINF